MKERSLTVYIQDLDISDKSKYALLRMKIFTLNDLEKRDRIDISGSPKIGKDTIQELQRLQEHIEEIFYRFEARKQRISEIFDSVKEFSIEEIPLSNRALNALKRAEILKVGDMIHMSQKDIMELRNVGIMTRTEITSAIDAIISEGSEYFSHPHLTEDDGTTIDDTLSEEHARRIEQVVAEVGDITIENLPLGTRAYNAMKAASISTVGELLHMTEKDFSGLRNVGNLTKNEILTLVETIIALGSAYFTDDDTDVSETASAADTPAVILRGKGFDFPLIDVLSEKFFFKPARMTEWFGLSRQGIYNAIEKRSAKRREIWTGKQLSEDEYSILRILIKDRKFDYTDEQIICCCMNNRQDDLACLFIYDNEIKCFFLKDLPVELQEEISAVNYQKYTERELAGEVEGEIVYMIRKPFFLPTYPDKFRANAQLRGMTSDEYAMFISGYPIGDYRGVTDDKIIAYFEENLVDGKVYISSDSKNQWIRSLASRNGYSIKDFIELFGYESRMESKELTSDGARERHIEEVKKCVVHDNVAYFPTDSHTYRVLSTYCYNKGYVLNDYIKSLGFKRTTERPDVAQDVLEQDMQVRHSDGDFEDKVFAAYPLIGSRIIKPETLATLNTYARKYIDKVLHEPWTKLSLRAEMQITLALINNAKSWKNEENPNFWNYMSLQFGYRDASGVVVRLLQSSLEDAMKKNRRLFIEDSNGRAFKSTAVIHALTTRKSWMALFDFLFDFYKNNLNWRVIPGDPLLDVMIRSLQHKLAGDSTEDAELTISSRVYSFQEGIRKLVLHRPVFTRNLFEKLIAKIDATVNSEDKPVKTYEEQLCEEWFKEKITAIASTKRTERQNQGVSRDVAIDYSRIRAKYILKNETDIQIVLPDIRLKREDISRAAVLAVYYNNSIVLQQNMSWYGNELGKTLNGATVPLPALSSETETVNLQVKITCDNEEIYNSEDTLNRRMWVFYGSNECNIGQIKKDNYTVVLPRTVALEAENAEITEMDDFKNPGLQAFFLELRDGYALTAGGKLIAFDSENGTDIRVMTPTESAGLPRVSADDREYYFAYQDSACNVILGGTDFLQQFIILRNGEQIEFHSLPVSDNGLAFTFPLSDETGICRLQIINLADERLVFDRSFILIKKANCGFNREFYYSLDDYQNAGYQVNIDDFSEMISFGLDDEELRIPYRNGELHIAIPKVKVQETTGDWMDGSAPAWYIGDIPQTSLLKVSIPSKLNVRFFVDGKDIMYDGQGIVTIGNVLQSLCSTGGCSLTDIVMKISGINQSSVYTVAKVCYKECFLGQPEFWTEGQKLYWNQGGTFIGKKDRKFTLSLYGETKTPNEFQLDESTEYVEIPADMPIGNYHYEISILSGSLFKKEKEVIAEGDCAVGDQNLLRFKDRRIVIDSITDEFNESAGRISINMCYIDEIEFSGIEETSEGYCPVYRGVMYTEGYHGERYEFSFDSHTNKRGIKKNMVNPVRIVYINNSTLCITDSEGDGLYYYHYYNKYLCKKVYALTDRAYSSQNRHVYANADLYLYTTERI